MANKGGYSREGLFGTIHHYDAKGHKIGESRPGFFGGYNNYDAKGHKVGESRPAFFGGYNNYDAKGHKTGSTAPSFLGSSTQYDAQGHRIGSTRIGLLGEQKHSGTIDLNQAGGAAGTRQDARIMTAIEITAAGSMAASHAAKSDWFDDEDDTVAAIHSPKEGASKFGGGSAPLSGEPAKTVRYIIIRATTQDVDMYCVTNDEYQIGDRVAVDGIEGQAQVLAVVECLEDALPPETDTRFRVRKL